MSGSNLNPFARRDSHPAEAIWTYKILTALSWLLLVATSVYYSSHVPQDGAENWCHTIWGVDQTFNTPFAQNELITSIYWTVLFLSQTGYIWALFSSNSNYAYAAAGVGSHFILNNLLQFAWVMLFVHGLHVWSEFLLIANFINLSSLYFRHDLHLRFIHISVVSGPLAWTFIALYWNGAIAVNAHTLVARIIANVAIWGILVYGLFFLVAYKDHTIGFELTILAASIGVGQFLTHANELQWIFAFVIMAILFLATLVIAIPGMFGREFTFRRESYNLPADQERAPLLDDN